MNRQISNSYLGEVVGQYKQEKWFKVDFVFSFFSIAIQATICYYFYHHVFIVSSTLDANYLTFYYILVNVVSLCLVPAQYVTFEHMELINTGKIIPFLLRPYSYILASYLRCFTSFFMRCMVNLLGMFLFSIVMNVSIPIINLFLGVISMSFGFSILYLIQAIIGCFAIWFHDVLRFRDVFMSLLLIFGGKLIPSDLLLFNLKKFVFFTPIPYIYDIPVKIILGNSSKYDLIAQLIWIVLGVNIYIFIFYRYVKHNVEDGG